MNVRYAQLLKAVYELANRCRKDTINVSSSYFIAKADSELGDVLVDYDTIIGNTSLWIIHTEHDEFGFTSAMATTSKLDDLGVDPNTIQWRCLKL